MQFSSGGDTGGIPAGVICMWSGASTEIPDGWALCNGSNGTPDLRNRFIVGAGSSYSVGATGGSSTVTLSTAQMPKHTHTITVTDDGHYHTMSNRGGLMSGSAGWYDFTTGTTSSSIIGQAFTSATTTGITVSAATTGSGSSHENRPPYYALCFIMKL
jgi:microcystin-dependent protein